MNLETQISRRDLLKAGFGAAALLALGKIDVLAKSPSVPPNTESEPKNGTLILESPENEISHQMEMLGHMNYVPDGPITFWTTSAGKKRYLLTGGDMNQEKGWTGNATYILETDGSITLKEAMMSGQLTSDNFLQVFGPDENIEYRKHYAGITSVFQTDKTNPDHLLGITHSELRTTRNASADYTSAIGLVESYDGGISWSDKGPIITGTDVKEPGNGRVSGAGQPSAIYNPETGYINGLYIDWSAAGQHADQLYAFRIKVNSDSSLENVEYWTNTGFSETKDNLKPAIPVPTDGTSDLIYTALPHLSWNTKLNQYITVGESDKGFWFSKSSDLVNWTKPEIIYDFKDYGGKPHSILSVGEKWDSYPSFLDETQANSQITGEKGILYHSSGDNLTPHEPATLGGIIK